MCSPSGLEEGNDGINAMKQSMKETQDKVNSRQARSIVFQFDIFILFHTMLRLIAKKRFRELGVRGIERECLASNPRAQRQKGRNVRAQSRSGVFANRDRQAA